MSTKPQNLEMKTRTAFITDIGRGILGLSIKLNNEISGGVSCSKV